MSETGGGRKRGSRKSIAFVPSSALSKPSIGDNKENGGTRAAQSKKSRSKSLGPGELQRIANEEKQEKIIKSILQPAIPISPLQQIPSFGGKASKLKALAPPILVPLKTEQEQQEARQQREAQRSAAMTHREKRRKSLGGRRVSFNPEVTMHVLEEMRVANTPPSMEGDPTKTPGANARSVAAATPTPANAADVATSSEAGDSSDGERPSTPEKQVEHEIPEPESARLEHKKENRKPMTPMASFDRTEEFTGSPTPSSVFSSPAMTDDAESTLAPEDSSDEDDTGLISVVSPSVTARTDASDDDSDDMEIVNENEVTATFTPWIAREHNHPRLSHPETNFTSAPPRPQDSNPEMPFSGRRHDHPRLSYPETGFASAPRAPEIMRQDDEDDATMEITRVVGKGVLTSPSPARIGNRDSDAMEEEMTMEFTQAIGPGILSDRRLSTVSEVTDDDDVTMEITRAIGPGLLSAKTPQIQYPTLSEDQDEDDVTMEITRAIGPGLLSARTQPITYPTLPRFGSEEEEGDEQTMELTRAIGGIKSTASPQNNDADDEEMSMELTNVIGGVLANRAQHLQDSDDDNTASMDMDMTVAIGGIIEEARLAPAAEEQTEVVEPQSPTIATDLAAVTMNVNPSLSALVAEARARSASVSSTPPAGTPKRGRPSKSATPQKAKEATPKKAPTPRASGTPRSGGRTLRSSAAHLQTEAVEPVPEPVPEPEPVTPVEAEVTTPKAASKEPQATTTPKTAPKTATNLLLKKATTPKIITTPKVATPKTTTPRRSARTPQQNVTPTPKSTTLAGSGKVAVLDHGLSAKRRLAGIVSPGVHLTNMNSGIQSPSARGATGIGISKAGMGSPSVRKILSARKTIGTSELEPFSPGVRPLSQLLKDLKDDKKDDSMTSGSPDEVLRGAKGIKEMLERMTPKKGPLGAMPGSVGRPKRTFDSVKGDLINAAAEANIEPGVTGSPARKKRRSLEDQTTAAVPTPVVPVSAPTPAAEKPSVRFEVHEKGKKDEDVFGPAKAVTPAKSKAVTTPSAQLETESEMDVDEDEEEEADVPKMAMKDFLSMIGISFWDGIQSSRHRRQTGAILGLGVEMADEEISIADQIVGQLTIRPFLELYEHLQRELKRSNKEGKEIFKQIEKTVLEENPRLFKEYVLAPPDVKSVMDMQFKNIKSSSNLEARGDWYTWRQGLQETIKAKAEENLAGLKIDETALKKWKGIVDQLKPELEGKAKELSERVEVLKARKEEIESSDPKELEEKREALKNAKKRLDEKKRELERLTQEGEELEAQVIGREERKQRCLSAIESAERVAEANKGYTEEEVVGGIERIRQLEEKTGWSLKKAESPCFLEMIYKKNLGVRFNAQQPDSKDHPVELTLLNTPAPLTQQKFFVESIQTSTRQQKFEKYKDMLKYISERWDRASSLLAEMEKVSGPYPNAVSFEEGAMVFMADMLVLERKAKVRVRFTIEREIMGKVGVRAEAVYGEGMSGWKLDEYLQRVIDGEGMGWREAMGSLGRQLSGK